MQGVTMASNSRERNGGGKDRGKRFGFNILLALLE